MIIDGKQLSLRLKGEMAEEVKALEAKYGRVPSLAVILVGENPASQSYVRGKIKAAEEVGIRSELITMAADTTEEALLAEIDRLNADKEIDGVLVQLPLPKHIDSQKVIARISPDKDVDGFHPMNVAGLWLKEECIVPCTPKGIIKLLNETGVKIEGAEAVVVGRSNIVGLPVAKLLLDNNATVTIAHSRTKNLAEVTRRADILVVAIGKERLITADMIKPGAIVIDVGVNRRSVDGKLCGDVDYQEAQHVASHITPVPGGVGPMTIACLMENTVENFIRREERKN
jgi:methylenetetrahydrofolate dehydrogenase (NADP+)/methenyltetrahydrofolate cyclohydrolase